METIAVALSGGADSLLSLLLLRDAGKDVMGVHAHFLPPSEQELALTDAIASTCHSLGIAFQAIDLHCEFEANVIAPFLDGYRRGLTPNPCALCNPTMKFGLLLEKVRTLGATTLATGVLPLKRLAFKIGENEWADTSMVADDVQVKFKLALTGVGKL